MIDHADNIIDLNAILHPGSVYDHPRDVVADTRISIAEKRAILASWASDAASVTSNPALRELPGSHRMVTIDEVLEALSALDHEPKAGVGSNRITSKAAAPSANPQKSLIQLCGAFCLAADNAGSEIAITVSPPSS